MSESKSEGENKEVKQMCSPDIEFLHISGKGPFPTHLAISTLFIMSDFTGKGLYWQMHSLLLTDTSSLSFYLCLSFLSKKC